jgi:hypothetical protein
MGVRSPWSQNPWRKIRQIPPGRVRTVQRPVYYISEVLHDAKMRYLEVHKLLYAVLIASRKLRHYFQAHKILVVSSYLLRTVLHNPNVTGNIAKWATELVEFVLDFLPHQWSRAKYWLISLQTGHHHHATQGARTTASQSLELRSSPGLTGLSSMKDPHESKGPMRGSCSLPRQGSNSSAWSTSTSRQPTTWQSMRPSYSG